jgi:hypothetical protein
VPCPADRLGAAVGSSRPRPPVSGIVSPRPSGLASARGRGRPPRWAPSGQRA